MNQKKPKTTILSLRLSHEERAALSERAGSLALGEYIRLQLFHDEPNRPARKLRRKPQSTTPDKQALSQLLAKLGGSNIAASLAELARAVRLGALAVTPETEQAIQAACRAVLDMKSMLMQALSILED